MKRNLRGIYMGGAAARALTSGLCSVGEDDEIDGGAAGGGTALAGDGGTAASLRDSLADAFDAATGDDGAASPAGGQQQAAAPTPKPAKAAASGEPARDESGRFAKPGEPAQSPQDPKPVDQQAAPGEPQAQAGIIAPPSSWSATAKAEFAKLSPVIQQEVLKRERDMETGKAQWQQGAERLNRLDAVLRPRLERFRLAGVDEARAVETLFAAQDYLERSPVDALLYLGRQSGVDWRSLFQRLQGGQGQPQQQVQALPPEIQHLTQQVQSLTNTVTQQQRAAQEGQLASHVQTVQQFAADPANIYFDNVKTRMSKLIREGDAKDLADAYQQACWADPEIRPLMLSKQQTDQAAQTAAANRAKVQQARNASVSVTGSPAPGASPGGVRPAPKTVRDALSDAWDATT